LPFAAGFYAPWPRSMGPGFSRRNQEGVMKEFQALDDQLSRPVSLAPPQESETLRVLRRGRERITKGWIRHHLAADAYGDPVYSPDASTARYWCALGAISW